MIGEQAIHIERGDIFEQDVDAIVNPANRFMLHGGGLAGIIARRAGDEVVSESQAFAPIPTGSAIVTGPGDLLFRGIIHAVGPVWGEAGDNPYWRRNSKGGTEDVDELLAEVHKSVLTIADEEGFSSIALPAISCGVFGFPVDRAAPIALRATLIGLRDHPTIERVVFCLVDEGHLDAFLDAAKTIDGTIDGIHV